MAPETFFVGERAPEGGVHDVLKRFERLAAMTDQQFRLVALEIEARAVGGVFDGDVRIDAERGDETLEELDDRLCGVGHMNQELR